MPKIAASIMCGDQLHLGKELLNLKEAGIDWLHCDVMDGVFVNNLAMAPYVLEPIIEFGGFMTDIHLACVEPEKYVKLFVPLKPDYLTFHIEVANDPHKLIQQIHDHGIKAGIALSPETPIEAVIPYLHEIELILMMTVNPGFAGQAFQWPVLDKLKLLQETLAKEKIHPLIEVDGNIHSKTVTAIHEIGADLYVVGTSALFNKKAGSYQKKVAKLMQILSL